jgi:RNA polymerase sigma-70 factor (ECF subfamily)
MVGPRGKSPIDVRQLFERYGPTVHRRALYLLRDAEEAKEAVQDVFVRALRGAKGFQQKSNEYTWLMRITTNLCLNRLRNNNRREELWQQHAPKTDLPGAPSIENLLLIRQLLSDADFNLAQVAVYVLVDGLSHTEVAKMIGVSRRKVGRLLERFRKWALAYSDPD